MMVQHMGTIAWYICWTKEVINLITMTHKANEPQRCCNRVVWSRGVWEKRSNPSAFICVGAGLGEIRRSNAEMQRVACSLVARKEETRTNSGPYLHVT